MKGSRALEDVVDALPRGAGAIGLLSGDEYTDWALEFDRALIGATGARVGLLLCADHDNAEGNARRASAYFRALGADPVVLDVAHGRPARAARRGLGAFDVLYVGGGSPSDLLACMRGSPVWGEALGRWRAGKGLAGSSAGAMALALHCLIPKEGADKPTVWAEGLGPLQKVGLAVHASSRPREWLEDVTSTAPVPVLALDDHVGVILRPENPPLVIGNGSVWIEERANSGK